jgi:hypothetical protein
VPNDDRPDIEATCVRLDRGPSDEDSRDRGEDVRERDRDPRERYPRDPFVDSMKLPRGLELGDRRRWYSPIRIESR